MSDNGFELVVIGAGISGLGFAHLAKRRGIKSLVLEATDHVGGCINSHRFATADGPYWAELGAHTCYNSYGNLLRMLEDTHQLGSLQAKQKLRYQLQTAEGLTSIPSQLNFLELLGLPLRMLRAKKAGHTAREYFGGILGKQNFSRVLGPALDAVACQSAAEFPADALFRKKPRRKEIMRSYTGPQGLQSFVDGISSQSGFAIRTDSQVTRIEQTDKGFRLDLKRGEPVLAQSLALAVAPDVAAGLLQPTKPQLSEDLARIGMAEIESLAVLLPSEALTLPPLAGIIGRDDDFYSVVSRDLIPASGYRSFTFHFRPGRLDEAGKLARICQVLGVKETAIQDRVAIANRLPALRLGHQQLIVQVDQQLAGTPLALTGNWFSGVSIEDSLVRTADEFVRLFPG